MRYPSADLLADLRGKGKVIRADRNVMTLAVDVKFDTGNWMLFTAVHSVWGELFTKLFKGAEVRFTGAGAEIAVGIKPSGANWIQIDTFSWVKSNLVNKEQDEEEALYEQDCEDEEQADKEEAIITPPWDRMDPVSEMAARSAARKMIRSLKDEDDSEFE